MGMSDNANMDEYDAVVTCIINKCDSKFDSVCINAQCSAEWSTCFGHHDEGGYPTVGDSCQKAGDIGFNVQYYDTNWNFHQFADFYQKKKVILFVVSATSCPNCKQEAQDMAGIIADVGEENIGVLEVILDDGVFADMDVLINWDTSYGGHHTGAPSNRLKAMAYLPGTGSINTPLNFYIDGDTMQIIKVVEGYDAASIKDDLQGIIDN